VKLVCFDLGGVVVRIHASFSDASRAAGLPVRADAEDRYQKQAPLLTCFARGEMPLCELAPRLSAALSGLYSPAELEMIHHAWIIAEYEGVADLVDSLLARQVECAVLSNTDASHWDRMLRWPTLARISHRFASHLIGAAKPAAEAFVAVQRETGYAPEQILFFDDTLANVEAARSLAWQAHQILPSEPPVTQMSRTLRAHNLLP
jgi:putative hydrolase of the HAD superfamily